MNVYSPVTIVGTEDYEERIETVVCRGNRYTRGVLVAPETPEYKIPSPVEKYLFDHPELEECNTAIKKAWNTGKLIRRRAGWYFVRIGNEMVEIEHIVSTEENTDWSGWVAKEMSSQAKWYSDPANTLKELKAQLGIS